MSTYPLQVSKGPGRDEQVQELPSPQGLLALTKTFPFSTGWTEILRTHLLHPSLERKAKVSSQVDTPGWQRHRKVSCFPKKIHTSTEVNCAHTVPTKQGKHLWVRGAGATAGASSCDFCSYLLICHLCPCKYEPNIGLWDSGCCTGEIPECQIHLRCDCDCHTSTCVILSPQGAAVVPKWL